MSADRDGDEILLPFHFVLRLMAGCCSFSSAL